MALTDEVAAKIMGEIHVVTTQIDAQLAQMEKLAAQVRTAAQEVNSGKNALQSQAERHLQKQFALLTDVVNSLKSSEEALRQSGPQDARALLAPLIEEMGKHVKTLSDKQHWAAQLLTSANKIQSEMAAKMFYVAMIGILLFFGGGAAGYLLGHGFH